LSVHTIHGGHGHFGSSSLDDVPLLGREGEPIEGEVLEELLRRQIHPSGNRKRVAGAAYEIYRSCYEQQVLDGINLQQNSATIKKDMKRFLTLVRNDARDVTEQVAVVWDNRPQRKIVGEDDADDEDATKAIQALATQSRFDVIAMMVNHLAWLQGPQYVVPMVRGTGRRRGLRADVLSPHVYDIVQDEDDPLGEPVGLAWHLHTRKIGAGQFEDDIFVLDSRTLRRFKARVSGNKIDVSETVVLEHNYGKLPAAGLRFTTPIVGDDWFLCGANSRLRTGTVEVAVTMARMGLVRRAQCHQLLTVVGAIADAPKGQAPGDPEGGLIIPARSGSGSVDVSVHDYDTDPARFIRQILFHVQSMIEPLGGHIQVDSGQPDIFGKVDIPYETQVEHRDRQLPAAEAFERDWWAAVTVIAKAEGLDVALSLPSPDEVHEGVRTDFGKLSRSLKDPEKATAADDAALSRGQTSEVELMREKLGGASRDEAWKVIERNMEDRGRFNDMATRSNLPSGEGGATTTAEAMGALGTPQREANKGESGEAGGPDPATPTAAGGPP
jgi:hypothetical protein